MKNMLYKAKGALALTLAVSICGAQCVPVFAAEALSAAQQGVQVTPVKELTEEGGIAAAEADRRGSIGEGEKA